MTKAADRSTVLTSALVPYVWTVVAGPPGSPKTLTTYEDPARLAKLLRRKEVGNAQDNTE